MTPETTLDLFRQGIFVAILMVSVLVIPGLIVGLIIAMFQAATQINEMSLSFVPKIIITFLTLILTGPWLLRLIINYAQNLIIDIPHLIG